MMPHPMHKVNFSTLWKSLCYQQVKSFGRNDNGGAVSTTKKQFLVSFGQSLLVSIELNDTISVIKNRIFFMPFVIDRHQKKIIYGASY
jgi:hypothetical protein